MTTMVPYLNVIIRGENSNPCIFVIHLSSVLAIVRPACFLITVKVGHKIARPTDVGPRPPLSHPISRTLPILARGCVHELDRFRVRVLCSHSYSENVGSVRRGYVERSAWLRASAGEDGVRNLAHAYYAVGVIVWRLVIVEVGCFVSSILG